MESNDSDSYSDSELDCGWAIRPLGLALVVCLAPVYKRLTEYQRMVGLPCILFQFILPSTLANVPFPTDEKHPPKYVWIDPWSPWCYVLLHSLEPSSNRCIYTETIWHFNCKQTDSIQLIIWLLMGTLCNGTKFHSTVMNACNIFFFDAMYCSR